jgi:hypothetical protein
MRQTHSGGASSTHRADAANAGEALPRFVTLGDPVLEVNNNQYPTGVFQRRIVSVREPSGDSCLALEEDMSAMRPEAVGCDRTVTVASIRDEASKFAALDRVLDETGFDAFIEERLRNSAKGRDRFLVALKPNFMFAYNKADRTTYTDPELVGRLVERLRRAGFRRIAVVEARSTYGEYFTRRSVREVAEYVGYGGEHEIVDMSEDATDQQDLGPHLGTSRSPASGAVRISASPSPKQDSRLLVLHADAQEHLRGAPARQQVQGIPLQQGQIPHRDGVPFGVPRPLRTDRCLPQRRRTVRHLRRHGPQRDLHRHRRRRPGLSVPETQTRITRLRSAKLTESPKRGTGNSD